LFHNSGYTPLHAACVVFSDRDDEVLAEVLKHPGKQKKQAKEKKKNKKPKKK
jgi:hypothetical protein